MGGPLRRGLRLGERLLAGCCSFCLLGGVTCLVFYLLFEDLDLSLPEGAQSSGFGTDARVRREESERREALRTELSEIDGWGFTARRRRREVRAKLAALGEAE